MKTLILLSFANACISYTISQTLIFKPFRYILSCWNDWIGELVSCGYCLGHWVAFILVAIYHPYVVHSYWLIDWFITSLILAWLSGIQWGLFTILLTKIEE